jgi:hypothetical protein
LQWHGGKPCIFRLRAFFPSARLSVCLPGARRYRTRGGAPQESVAVSLTGQGEAISAEVCAPAGPLITDVHPHRCSSLSVSACFPQLDYGPLRAKVDSATAARSSSERPACAWCRYAALSPPPHRDQHATSAPGPSCHGTLPGGSNGVLLGRGYSLGTLRGVSAPSVDAWGVEMYIYIYIYIYTYIYTLHVSWMYNGLG